MASSEPKEPKASKAQTKTKSTKSAINKAPRAKGAGEGAGEGSAAPVFDLMSATSGPSVPDEAREFFEVNGFVVVRVLGQQKCEELICEQWDRVIGKQPWNAKSSLQAMVPASALRSQAELARYVTGPLDPKTRKEFEAKWPLHRGFGACCDPCVFNLPGVWKIRQDPRLYELATKLTGTEDLWVDINRSIQKLPGQGEDELLHWDWNPFFAAQSAESVESASVCGKVCYTKSRFVCVPRTHTREFIESFVAAYTEYYPNVRESDPKFGLDATKPDPFELGARKLVIAIERGCAVFWDARLLHGQVKTPLGDPVEYGCYLGYFRAGSRPAYERACGVDELEDRLASYTHGRAPKLWPSFDPIQFYPKRFRNFPKLLQAYIDKMPSDHPSICTRVTKGGKTVPHLEPWPVDPEYTPPPLTELGRKLLGGRGQPPSLPCSLSS